MKVDNAGNLNRDITVETARALFPGAHDAIYLNVAGRGLLSTNVSDALNTHFKALTYGTVDKGRYFEMVERVREKFGRLINADSDEIAFTKNVSDGLNQIAGAIEWRAGDNIVLCTELEHPNNVYPWLNLRDRLGIEVRSIPHKSGAIDIPGMIAAIDDKTRLATASTVTFSPGIRADIETLGASCRDRGVFLLVDAAQSVGVMHTDVRKMKVDGLAVATQKALLGLYGMGFLYCRREWAEKMHPAALARFSVDLGDDMHEASTGSDAKYSLMPAARRFDVGNYNYPAVCAVEPSLDLLLTLGTSKIDHYVCGLSAYFTAGLKELGLTVCSGLSESELSHTVTVGSYSQDANESASDPEIAAIARYLQDNKIAFSLRRGLMRFASHLYNNQSDIDTVLEIIRGWKNSHQ